MKLEEIMEKVKIKTIREPNEKPHEEKPKREKKKPKRSTWNFWASDRFPPTY